MTAWERKKSVIITPPSPSYLKRGWGGVIFIFFFILLFPATSLAIPLRILRIEAPPLTEIVVSGAEFQTSRDQTRYSIILSEEASFPLKVTAKGPLGGIVSHTIESPSKLKEFRIDEKIIRDKDPNPKILSDLPILCPRVTLQNGDSPGKARTVYSGKDDRLNHIPMFQLLDPDSGKGAQHKSFVEMDGKNVLLLERATVRYDYEDSSIVDYEGPHPITGKPHKVMEGQGGFYANIHFAVLPFKQGDKELDRQTLLHLAQGKLREINREDLLPPLRTHSMIPGPFLSKEQKVYEMCEWGDTAYQAPEQTVHYEEMALWDWDYSIPEADHLLLIVWEGDEEDWLIRKELIHPFYLTDDLIGAFEIRRYQTIRPLTLTNDRKDFEIIIVTGDLAFPP